MMFDEDGAGPGSARLLVGGAFTDAGGQPAPGLASWNGDAWEAVNIEVPGLGTAQAVTALSASNADIGALYAGAAFRDEFGNWRRYIVRRDQAAWKVIGGPLAWQFGTAKVNTLITRQEDGGEVLYIGGDFDHIGDSPASNIARWDGQVWTAPGGGVDVTVHQVLTDALEPAAGLLLVGEFFEADDRDGGQQFWAQHIARWDGQMWHRFQRGMFGALVEDFATFDDGNGPTVYAGGGMRTVGQNADTAWWFAKWNGSDWEGFGDKGRLGAGGIRALQVYDDGTGLALYAVGGFERANGKPAPGIARWDGASWAPVGGPLGDDPPTGNALISAEVYDDGTGPALFVAGYFRTDGTSGVARYNGSDWSVVAWTPSREVADMQVFDDGSGPALYAGGNFAPGQGSDMPSRGIARWDGHQWEPVGELSNSLEGDPGQPNVLSLTVWDDGSGPRLYACGFFNYADGEFVGGLASWDGAQWRAVSPGTVSGGSLTAGDLGDGPSLYMNGVIPLPEGARAGVGRWDGASWQFLGQAAGWGASVAQLAVLRDATGPALFVVGDFLAMDGVESGFAAVWRGCPGCYADCSGDGTLDLADYLCFAARFSAKDAQADCDDSGALDLFDFLCFVNAFNAGC
jgi:hypothetical protein